jgi:hypothetical protein
VKPATLMRRQQLGQALDDAVRALYQPRWGFLRNELDIQRLLTLAERAAVELGAERGESS